GTAHYKAEDIVNEQQHVASFVTEIFRHRQARERHTQTRARRLVHLTKDHDDVFEHPRLLHFEVEVIAFAGAFAHAAKDRKARVLGGDGANELLNNDCLAHACAAKHANFAAFGKGGDEVNDFHACFKKLRGRDLIFKT